MKTVSFYGWKHLNTYIMVSFVHLQFQLFLHFCVSVQQSQILPFPLSMRSWENSVVVFLTDATEQPATAKMPPHEEVRII